jgi:YVTN family beta-propeller protein
MRNASVALCALLAVALLAAGQGGAALGQGQSVQREERVVATISVGRGPHGVAVDEETDRVYVANLSGGTLSVIDGSTNEVIATIAAEKGPRDVAVNRRTNRVYVPGIAARSMAPARWLGFRLLRPVFAVSVLDSRTQDTLAQVPVGINPWIIEVSERANRIYVANYASYNVSVIDGESHDVIDTIEMGSFRTPGGIAVDEVANRVYIANTLHLGPLDLGGGRLVIVDGDTHRVVDTLRVGRRAQVAVNQQTHRVYVASRQRDTVDVIDGDTHARLATVDVGPDPYGLAVNEGANRIYVANHGGRSVSVIDGDSHDVLREVEVGRSPTFVAVNEATGRVYVTNSADDTVSVIEGAEEARR